MAVEGARAFDRQQPGAVPSTLSAAPVAETKVIDPDTGAQIPVAPVDETRSSVPIVQPIPNDAGDDDTPQN